MDATVKAMLEKYCVTRSPPITMNQSLASQEQTIKIMSYLEIGRQEGAELLTGGVTEPIWMASWGVGTISIKGHNKMRIFREEIFGPGCYPLLHSRRRQKRLSWPTISLLRARTGIWSRDGSTAYPWDAQSKRGVSGPTATTPIRLTQLSAESGNFLKTDNGNRTGGKI